MQDRQLYEQILGIGKPWFVDEVELRLEQGEVHVYLKHKERERWACAECGALCRLYDHQPERSWRHLDTCQYRTILHAEPPRTECEAHGVRAVRRGLERRKAEVVTRSESMRRRFGRGISRKAKDKGQKAKGKN